MPSLPCQHKNRRHLATLGGIAVFGPCVAIGTVLFWQCVALIRIEHQLQQAAQCALQEAALPHATYRSTLAAADRALQSSHLSTIVDQPMLAIFRKDVVYGLQQEFEPGDEIRIILGAYAGEIAPDWLKPFGISLSGRKIRVSMTTLIR